MFADAQLNEFVFIGFLSSFLIIFLDGLRKSTDKKQFLIETAQNIIIIGTVGLVFPITIWNFVK